MSLREVGDEIGFYYSTMKDDVVAQLYRPCLRNSSTYRRGVGYFRSSAFRLMTQDLVQFCLKGGRMEIITSTDIDPNDHKAAMEGYGLSSFYETLEEMLDEETMREPTRLLCALVATGHLTIKIAVVPLGGIYHDKVGYFEDGADPSNIVAFSGSGNETYSALRGEGGNIEMYNIIWNWHDSWTVHGEKWKKGLDDAINGKSESFEVLDFSEIDESFLKKHSISTELSDYVDDEEEPEFLESTLPTLHEHQFEGLARWRENGCRGVLKHATASGKTITAISALEEHMKTGGNAVILVPTRVLLKQWDGEIKRYLHNAIVGKIGGGSRDTDLLNMMRRSDGSDPLLVISTIRSASTDKVLRMMKRVIGDGNTRTLLVVDECHNIGSEGCADLCATDSFASLGLSATPDRMGDPEGTDRVFRLLGPVVHEFGLRDALRHEPPLLTPYEYHISTVDLTSEEQSNYDNLKAKISRLFAIWSSSEEPEKSQLKGKLDVLNFSARRIVRGASGKLDAMSRILKDRYEENQHWIIYCDTRKMMSEAEVRIRDLGVIPKIYYSEMDDFNRSQSLISFEREGGLLLAMKCLDEGVNITCISHGMVLSSTTNPREFIQRRGRMLRLSPGKEIAHIFDAFALPNKSADNTGFLLSELLRAKELSEDSENRISNVIEINTLIREHGVTSIPELEMEVETID